MRIALLAYEYPPAASPQANRWGRLSYELALLGHELTVIAPQWPGVWLPVEGVAEIRTSPGFLYRCIERIRASLGRGASAGGLGQIPGSMHGLSWRGKLVVLAAWPFKYFSFPDLRAQWNRGSLEALERLLSGARPDLVITSHEPASVLELGLVAASHGIPWVADLGDPIVAPYTPRRWQRRARRLEERVCAKAALVLVTTNAYREKLVSVNEMDPARCKVLRQGFDQGNNISFVNCAGPTFKASCMELLFTGQFYRFRSPDALFQALGDLEGVRLTVITPTRDPALRRAQALLGDKLRVIGPLLPECVHAWQAGADILVNIANELPLQIPGKLFEYFGAGRGILHLSSSHQDESAELIRAYRRGWITNNNAVPIRAILEDLLREWRRGELGASLDLSSASVARFSWNNLALQLDQDLAEIQDQAR